MDQYSQNIHDHYDQRTAMLGKIKAKGIDSDEVVLLALSTLVYAQLEGGIKDLSSTVLKQVRRLGLTFRDIHPSILEWRNPDDLERFRRSLSYKAITEPNQFDGLLQKRVQIRGIDRQHELNQMSWKTVKRIYSGLNLTLTEIEVHSSSIDQIVVDRNNAAHYGVIPGRSRRDLEQNLRENAIIVEKVLTDFSLQLLLYFQSRRHKR